MNTSFNLKNVFATGTQWLGAFIAFILSLLVANLLLPMAPAIQAATPPTGFLSMPAAFLFNGAINALVLVWAARRSSFKGLARVAQLTALSFGAQTLMTQIETAYFLSAFPLLNGNFETYNLVLRGLLTSSLFALLVSWITGGFSRGSLPLTEFTATNDSAVKAGAWLAVVYIALYMIFGYYVAWQSQELRLFYGGPAELNTFWAQWSQTLIARPEIPAFQYFRGVLWMLCLVPLFLGFTGKRTELVALSALALALLPTAQLAFPNPLMPAGVSLGHFWEVSISTGIFGALCACFVPVRVGVRTM